MLRLFFKLIFDKMLVFCLCKKFLSEQVLASECTLLGVKPKPVVCGKEKPTHLGGWGGVFLLLFCCLEKNVW